jgi:mitochondrial fission protein ELM1
MKEILTGRPSVLVLDSDFTGELNARLGVAERLGYEYRIVRRPSGGLGDYLDYLKSAAMRDRSHGLPAPIVVLSGTGEDTIDEIADIKMAFDGDLLNVYLASILPVEPSPRLWEYDLIASPQIQGSNVVSILGVPHRVTRPLLDKAGNKHSEFFAQLTRPVISVLIGGNTRYCFGFDVDYAVGLVSRIKRIAAGIGGTVVATNSRRTPLAAWAAISAGLGDIGDIGAVCFDWQTQPHDLYLALLEEGDVFIATGDSLSMCSEVASTGKPLLIDLSLETTEPFHREILGRLCDYGAARPLAETFTPWTYDPPDPTGVVAQAIKDHLLCANSVMPVRSS